MSMQSTVVDEVGYPLSPGDSCTTSPYMRPLVCFGYGDGLGEVEISTTSENIVSRECFPTVFYEEQRSGGRAFSRPKEEIRLFHTQPLIYEEDDDNEELSFEPSPNNAPLFLEPNATPRKVSPASSPSRLPTKDVLAVIDELEKALDDVHALPKEATLTPLQSKRFSSSSTTLHSFHNVMARFRPQPSLTRKDGSPSHTKSKTLLETNIVPKQKFSSALRGKTLSPGGAWNRLFPFVRNRKTSNKRASDTALLIPHKTKESDWLLPDGSLQGIKAAKKVTQSAVADGRKEIQQQRSHQKKKKVRFRHLLRMGGCTSTGHPLDQEDDSNSQVIDLYQDDTRSLSQEDEQDQYCGMEAQPERTFRNDEELLDHLVKVCDTSSSLEEGFNCLQERLRTHSFSKTSSLKDTETSDVATIDNIFSTSFLDMPSLQATPKFTSTSSPTISRIPGSPTKKNEAPTKADPRNESLPSFGSVEEFLASVNDSDHHSASLEALLFEQELEKLSTEELAALLDEELEKLMRDGLA